MVYHMKYITLSSEYTEAILHDANVWNCAQCLSSIFPFNALENDVDFISAIADFDLSFGKKFCYLTEKNYLSHLN